MGSVKGFMEKVGFRRNGGITLMMGVGPRYGRKVGSHFQEQETIGQLRTLDLEE